MSTAVSLPVPSPARLHTARPSFMGIVRGELFKISRQWATWIFGILYICTIIFPYFVLTATGRLKETATNDPTTAGYDLLGADMVVLKVFGGALLIAVTARLIGMEYTGGTIRVLLARGVGRLQLLFGKLAALVILALAVVVVTVALDLLLTVVSLLLATRNLDLFQHLPNGYWSDGGTYLLLALISIGVTILMTTAVTVVGRSLAVGLSVSLLWYPAENISVLFLFLATRLTNSNFWLLLSGDFLGLNLNAMPAGILPARAAQASSITFQTPLTPVTGGHTLLVVAIYALVFAATAIVLTARRDVRE